MISGAPINVIDYGAIGDNSTDDTVALQAAFNALENNGCIIFPPSKTYKTTSAIVASNTLTNCIVEGNGSTIRAAHNGDGLNLTSINENASRWKLYNLNIIGPNVSFPNNAGELAGTSTGAGLKFGADNTTNTATAYASSIINCSFSNFYYGVYMQAALLCNFNGGYISFNQYGIYVDAGQTNANTFLGVGVRQNRIFGVYSSETTGGALTFATSNKFYGCTFETNIPYNLSAGGYPATFDGTQGFGVKLWNSYDWVFDGCYFENHNYSIMVENSSDDNVFQNCRFDSGGAAGVRPGAVIIAAATCNNNRFIGCKMSDIYSSTDGTFQILSAGAFFTQIIDCIGFRFNSATFLGVGTNISNNTKAQGTAGNGQNYGAIQMPFQGYLDNPGEGSVPGTITGIATATATLNSFGFGEIRFGSQITGATTITTISDIASKGKILTLINYQNSYSVVIQSAANGTGTIVLTGFTNVTMNNFGQMLVLYCTSANTFYEIGRNF